MVKLAVTGACGRMGQMICRAALQEEHARLTNVTERKDHPDLGKLYSASTGMAGVDLKLSDALIEPVDVLIDFTTPESTRHWVEVCREHGIAMVIGTTGLQEEDIAVIREASKTIAVVQAPNMSIGMNLLFRLVEQTSRIFGADYDIEIVEQHHRFKKDAPSGSALGLLEAAARGLGKKAGEVGAFGREGREATRKPGEIGVHAVRLGDTVGEHAVYFGTLGETVTLSHSAHSRETFALGAIRAAVWVAGKQPGFYTMQDVLFGKEG